MSVDIFLNWLKAFGIKALPSILLFSSEFNEFNKDH